MDVFMHALTGTGIPATLLSLVALFVLHPFARLNRLVDVPGHRKTHTGAVPLIGGLSVFVGLFLAWMISMPLTGGFGLYLFCSLLLVLLGAVDDALGVPARIRLGAQVALGAILFFGSGVYLTGFGNLLGLGEILLDWMGPLVTIAAVIGATNVYNMVDGIDGLAGSMSLVTLGSLALLFSMSSGFKAEFVLAIALVMALLPYIAANLRLPPFRTWVFMGDAGSMFIGFSVVWLLVNGAQPDIGAFRPVTALWVCAIPLMDMAAIMIRRARKGQSVMRPDRDHLHHIFLRAGFTDRQALVVITVFALALAGFGILGDVLHWPEWLMFGLFMAFFGGYSWAIGHVWRLLVLIRRVQSKPRQFY